MKIYNTGCVNWKTYIIEISTVIGWHQVHTLILAVRLDLYYFALGNGHGRIDPFKAFDENCDYDSAALLKSSYSNKTPSTEICNIPSSGRGISCEYLQIAYV